MAARAGYIDLVPTLATVAGAPVPVMLRGALGGVTVQGAKTIRSGLVDDSSGAKCTAQNALIRLVVSIPIP